MEAPGKDKHSHCGGASWIWRAPMKFYSFQIVIEK